MEELKGKLLAWSGMTASELRPSPQPTRDVQQSAAYRFAPDVADRLGGIFGMGSKDNHM